MHGKHLAANKRIGVPKPRAKIHSPDDLKSEFPFNSAPEFVWLLIRQSYLYGHVKQLEMGYSLSLIHI